jgi:hypothetical protein
MFARLCVRTFARWRICMPHFYLHPLSHRGFERGEAQRTIEGTPRLLTPPLHPASSPCLTILPSSLHADRKTGDRACPEAHSAV